VVVVGKSGGAPRILGPATKDEIAHALWDAIKASEGYAG